MGFEEEGNIEKPSQGSAKASPTMTLHKPIKLVCYNIENGINSQDILKNISYFKKKGVSIFCLQEVRHIPDHEFIGDSIVEILDGTWDQHFLLDMKDPINSLGLGVFWKRSLGTFRVEDILLPKLNKYSFIERLVTPGGKPSQRGAIKLTVDIDDKKVVFINTHLDWQGSPEDRFNRIRFLTKDLNKSVISCVLCGDLNTRENKKFLGNSYQALRNAVGNNFIEALTEGIFTQQESRADDPTYPVLYLRRKILNYFGVTLQHRFDYVWYKNLKLINSKVYHVSGSDHFPLYASFSI